MKTSKNRGTYYSPFTGQRPYKDAIQLYSYCNREREVPEQSGDWRHICTEQF